MEHSLWRLGVRHGCTTQHVPGGDYQDGHSFIEPRGHVLNHDKDQRPIMLELCEFTRWRPVCVWAHGCTVWRAGRGVRCRRKQWARDWYVCAPVGFLFCFWMFVCGRAIWHNRDDDPFPGRSTLFKKRKHRTLTLARGVRH